MYTYNNQSVALLLLSFLNHFIVTRTVLERANLITSQGLSRILDSFLCVGGLKIQIHIDRLSQMGQAPSVLFLSIEERPIAGDTKR